MRKEKCKVSEAEVPVAGWVFFPFKRLWRSEMNHAGPSLALVVLSVVFLCAYAEQPSAAFFQRKERRPHVHRSVFHKGHSLSWKLGVSTDAGEILARPRGNNQAMMAYTVKKYI